LVFWLAGHDTSFTNPARPIRKDTKMNLTNNEHLTSTWNDVKTKSVIAAAGVALIASAVVSATPWRQSGNPATKATHFSSRSASQTLPVQVYYMVATEEERDMLATDFGGNYIVKGSDREALFYSDQVEAMTRASIDFRIIDTTKPNFGLFSSAGPVTNPGVLASVLSQEPASADRSRQQQVLVPDDYEGGVRAPRNLRERLQAQRGDFGGSSKASASEDSSRTTQADLVPSAASIQSQFGNIADDQHADQYPVAAWPRTLAVQPLSGNAADAESAANSLQADIMASVVSTENAIHGLMTPRASQRKASEGDIAASALSTERAAWAD
jgi:hypothetical protein